jgi:hypothetical protein
MSKSQKRKRRTAQLKSFWRRLNPLWVLIPSSQSGWLVVDLFEEMT